MVLFVPFLAGSCSVRYVSCDEAGAGETDISDMAVRGPTPDIVRLLVRSCLLCPVLRLGSIFWQSGPKPLVYQVSQVFS